MTDDELDRLAHLLIGDRHPEETADCPTIPRLLEILEADRGAESQHIQACHYCQKLIAMAWRDQCPTLTQLAAYLRSVEYIGHGAMDFHLSTDNCARCQLGLQLIRSGGGIEAELGTTFLSLAQGAEQPLVWPWEEHEPAPDQPAVRLEPSNGDVRVTVRLPFAMANLANVRVLVAGRLGRIEKTLALRRGDDCMVAETGLGSQLALSRKLGPECMAVVLPGASGQASLASLLRRSGSLWGVLTGRLQIPKLVVGLAGIVVVATIGIQFEELHRRSGAIQELKKQNTELNARVGTGAASAPVVVLETYAILQVPKGVMGVEEKPEEIVLPIPDAQSTKVRLPFTGLGSLDPAAPIQASLSDAKGAPVWGPAQCTVRDAGGKSIVVVEIPAATLAGHVRQGLVLQLDQVTGTLAAIGLRFQ